MENLTSLDIRNDEHIKLVESVFRGRPEVYAQYSSNGDGVYPVCRHFNDSGLCPKKSGKSSICSNCSQKEYDPLSESVLRSHLKGRIRIGVYPLLPDNTTWFIAADFDNHGGKEDEFNKNPRKDIKTVFEVCDTQGIPLYVLRSKSGNGYHAYLFFDNALPAWKTRLVFRAILEEAEVINDSNENNSFDRFFPNQDSLSSSDGLGNLIALPFHGDSIRSGNTIFLDPETDFTEPYKDQLDVLRNIQRVPESELDRLIMFWGLKQGETKSYPVSVVNEFAQSQVDKLLQCDFIRWCKERPGDVSVPLWWAMVTNCARLDPGEPEVCHDLSRGHPKYSPAETNKKVLDAYSYPTHTCQYIHSQGFECSKKCSVKAPIALLGKKIWNNKPEQLEDKEAIRELVLNHLPEAPVGPDIQIPPGWMLSYDSGIEKERIHWDKVSKQYQVEKESIAPDPVLITKRLIDIQNGNEYVEIARYRENKWNKDLVPRLTISSSSEIIKMADRGLPVTSINGRDMIDSLTRLEDVNIGLIPKTETSHTLGWQAENQAFLWGKSCISLNDEHNTKKDIVFRGNEGINQIADSLFAEGNYEDWIATVNLVSDFPLVMCGIYASLLAPLLAIIDVPSFTVDWSNPTSTGKTTVLRIAGSCWGNPFKHPHSSIVHTWDSTAVWVERAASLLDGIPLILDDTKTAGTGTGKFKDGAGAKISGTIYKIWSGQGRGRGSLDGLRGTDSFRTICLSSGEQPSTSFSEDGGTRGRVVELWAPPFKTTSQEITQIINKINQGIKNNFGHAGPKVVEFILNHQNDWDDWKKAYNKYVNSISSKAGSNPIAFRQTEYIAAFYVGAQIIYKALPGLKNISINDVLSTVWNLVQKENNDADRPLEALKLIHNYVVAHETKFWGRHALDANSNPVHPSSGWYGAWKRGNWEFIAFNSRTLRKFLDESGYEPDGIIRTWDQRGWLKKDASSKGLTKQVSINGESTHCYCLSRAVIEKELALDQGDHE